MTVRLIIIWCKQGPDRLMFATRPGPDIVEYCEVVSDGDGSDHVATLTRIGRQEIATRPNSWTPWTFAS